MEYEHPEESTTPSVLMRCTPARGVLYLNRTFRMGACSNFCMCARCRMKKEGIVLHGVAPLETLRNLGNCAVWGIVQQGFPKGPHCQSEEEVEKVEKVW